jgi:hypothetical protein
LVKPPPPDITNNLGIICMILELIRAQPNPILSISYISLESLKTF